MNYIMFSINPIIKITHIFIHGLNTRFKVDRKYTKQPAWKCYFEKQSNNRDPAKSCSI